MVSERCLCIFARAPELGRVKRRLARDLGAEQALSAHIELVEGTLQRCSATARYRTELWIADGGSEHPMIEHWVADFPVTLRQQTGADLGARMHYALKLALVLSDTAVLIGSDCPDIDQSYVVAAFDALDQTDTVFGPAEDGGYGLVGMARSALPECGGLFEGISWGGSDVLRETLARAARLGLTASCLEPVYDVDRIADWNRYRSVRADR